MVRKGKEWLGAGSFLRKGRGCFCPRWFNMPTAFVLVNSEIGAEEQVLETLRKVKEVKEAYMVYGVYDIVARVEADEMDVLKTIILTEIRGLESVRSTLTMIVVES
jgi:DNA-binding Lrp family transcriptional regulator